MFVNFVQIWLKKEMSICSAKLKIHLLDVNCQGIKLIFLTDFNETEFNILSSWKIVLSLFYAIFVFRCAFKLAQINPLFCFNFSMFLSKYLGIGGSYSPTIAKRN